MDKGTCVEIKQNYHVFLHLFIFFILFIFFHFIYNVFLFAFQNTLPHVFMIMREGISNAGLKHDRSATKHYLFMCFCLFIYLFQFLQDQSSIESMYHQSVIFLRLWTSSHFRELQTDALTKQNKAKTISLKGKKKRKNFAILCKQ